MTDLTNFNFDKVSMDKIFDTAGTALNTGREVFNALNNGFNQINGYYQDPNSRRNDAVYMNNGQQPIQVQYGYGYEERNPTYYPYGMQGSNYFNNSYVQNGSNNGYFGFTNPMYGKSGH